MDMIITLPNEVPEALDIAGGNPMDRMEELFGVNVFNDDVMQK